MKDIARQLREILDKLEGTAGVKHLSCLTYAFKMMANTRPAPYFNIAFPFMQTQINAPALFVPEVRSALLVLVTVRQSTIVQTVLTSHITTAENCCPRGGDKRLPFLQVGELRQ